MDVHQATTVVAVLNADGKIILETIVATEGTAIVRLLQGLSGPIRATFEETTQAAWLYEVVRAYVAEVIVCDPRRNRLLSEGLKGDKLDARKLAELLRSGLLRSVYHGHDGTRFLLWVTFREHKWDIPRDRRGMSASSRGITIISSASPAMNTFGIAGLTDGTNFGKGHPQSVELLERSDKTSNRAN
jgi:hypothetical protein